MSWCTQEQAEMPDNQQGISINTVTTSYWQKWRTKWKEDKTYLEYRLMGMMTESASSTLSRTWVVLVASSCCFLKASLTGSTMRGSRRPLKISLSPSIATKWQSALRQAWTEVLTENEERCKQMNENEQSQGHNRKVIKILRTCGCSTIKNNVAKYCGRLNEQLEKEGILLPTTSPRNATSHELVVLCHQIEEDIVNNNVDTRRIRFSYRSNGEGGRRQPWIAPH